MWVTPKFQLRSITAITAAIYIFVTPFVLLESGTFSLISIPANVVIMPFLPITIIFGFITGFFGLISHLLAIPFAWISFVFLRYDFAVINFFSALPFASFTIPNFPLWIVLLIYTYFIYWIFGKSIKKFFTEETI